MTRNGTVILKFFLHLSKDEQRKRFLKRLKDPAKQWKFSPADLKERGFWNDYMKAFEDAISATSTKWAPWYIIPADHKWVSRALVARIVTKTTESLDLRYPEVTKEQRAIIAEAKKATRSREKELTRSGMRDSDTSLPVKLSQPPRAVAQAIQRALPCVRAWRDRGC